MVSPSITLVTWADVRFIKLAEELLARTGFVGDGEFIGGVILEIGVISWIPLQSKKIPNRIKEWAYAGFAIDLICASVGFLTIDGFIAELLLPITAFIVVIINYFCFSKIQYSNA